MKISIFTPVHRVHQFFDNCIKSVCEQSYSNWEWIILDNSEGFIVENYVKMIVQQYYKIKSSEYLSKIKVYKHLSDNKKIGNLKSIAASLCVGNILCEMDYDDYLIEDALMILKDCVNKNKDCNFFFSDYINITHHSKLKYDFNSNVGEWSIGETEIMYLDKFLNVNIFGINKKWMKFDLFENGAAGLPIPIHIRAWKRDFYIKIGGYDKNLPVADDTDLVIKSYIFGKCCRIAYPCCIINYYGTNSTLNFTVEEINNLGQKIINKYYKQLKDKFTNEPNFVVEYKPKQQHKINYYE